MREGTVPAVNMSCVPQLQAKENKLYAYRLMSSLYELMYPIYTTSVFSTNYLHRIIISEVPLVVR